MFERMGVRQGNYRRSHNLHYFYHVLRCLLQNSRPSQVHSNRTSRSLYFLPRLLASYSLFSNHLTVLVLHSRLLHQYARSLSGNANLFHIFASSWHYFGSSATQVHFVADAFLSFSNNGSRYLSLPHNKPWLRCDRVLRDNMDCAMWK